MSNAPPILLLLDVTTTSRVLEIPETDVTVKAVQSEECRGINVWKGFAQFVSLWMT